MSNPPKIVLPERKILAPTPKIVAPTPAIWPDLTINPYDGEEFKPRAVTGLAIVTGHRGSGKSVAALSATHPGKIAFFDFEKKGAGYHSVMPLGTYVDILGEVSAVLGSDYQYEAVWDRTVAAVLALPVGRFSVLILDNIDPLLRGAMAKVENNIELQAAFHLKSRNVESGSMGGVWPGVSAMFHQLVANATARGVELVIVIAHLNDFWAEGAPVLNKFKITTVKALHELSIFTVVLLTPDARDQAIHNELEVDPGHPVMAVLKEQFGLPSWSDTKKRMQIKRRVPPRISPGSFWRLYHYLDNPADFRALKAHESLAMDELAPFSPLLSKEQLKLIKDIALFTRAQLDAKIREEGGGEGGG